MCVGCGDKCMMEIEFCEELLLIVQWLQQYCEVCGIKLGQFVIVWVLVNVFISSVIVGLCMLVQMEDYYDVVEMMISVEEEVLVDSLVMLGYVFMYGYNDLNYLFFGWVVRG